MKLSNGGPDCRVGCSVQSAWEVENGDKDAAMLQVVLTSSKEPDESSSTDFNPFDELRIEPKDKLQNLQMFRLDTTTDSHGFLIATRCYMLA